MTAIAAEAVLVGLGNVLPGRLPIIVFPAFFLLELPGLPLVFLFGAPIAAGNDHTWDLMVQVVIGPFSALVWSMLAGFIFRREAANKQMDRTPR